MEKIMNNINTSVVLLMSIWMLGIASSKGLILLLFSLFPPIGIYFGIKTLAIFFGVI